MLIIAYRFHVVPRRHNDSYHAWRAAEDTLQKVPFTFSPASPPALYARLFVE